MTRKNRADVPDNISEEYYQISEEILSSFSKFRPPVDLFMFREDIAQLYPLFRKGQRLTNEQTEEVQSLCHEGMLFVSRSDHHIYVGHLAKQADLVLLDANLKESEVADILIQALEMRLANFFEQPVLPVFEPLYRDAMVLTEYLWQDNHRAKLFMRRLHRGEATLVKHSMNVCFVGLWLYINYTGELRRRNLDRVTLGLLLLDCGMSKIPAFILNKTTALTPDDWEKVHLHPLAGVKMLRKLDLAFDELNQAILQHQERLDGSGYPQKLKGDAISQMGKLAAVASSFAAMVTKRPYAEAKEPLEAAKQLSDARNKFDAHFAMPLFNAYLTNEFGPAPGAAR